jgi:hypothetical protein
MHQIAIFVRAGEPAIADHIRAKGRHQFFGYRSSRQALAAQTARMVKPTARYAGVLEDSTNV